MDLASLALGIIIGLVVVGVVLLFAKRKTQDAYLDRFERFQESVERRLDTGQEHLNRRVGETERTARELSMHFGHLREALQTMLKTNTEILDFQKMLSAPSARGGFGEVLLETLFRDILPDERYELQHTLPNGNRADAIIKLHEGHIVAVDAKFPLSGYEQLVHASSEKEREEALRAFSMDVKKHAKDIAERYISEQDRTLPFAFMYIPTEGVYYEIVRNPNLWNSILERQVYPVSPNSFVPYMYTVLVGLKGLKVEQEARNILELLARMQKDFNRVDVEFSKVGKHLEQAMRRQEDASKVFSRLQNRVDALGVTSTDSLGIKEDAQKLDE